VEWPPLVAIEPTNGQKCRRAYILGAMTHGASRRRRRLAFLGVIAAGLVLSACSSAGDGQVSEVAPAAEPVAVAVTQVAPTPRGAMSAEGIVTVGLTDPYTPTSTGAATDDYRCFLLDLGLEDDRMVTGVRFVPGNPAVVHHAIVYRVEPSQVAGALSRDVEDAEQGWSCFGGPDLPAPTADDDALSAIRGAAWLAAWAPGGREAMFGDDVGVAVAAGSHAVLQVHYNLLGGPGPDLTEVQLRTEPDDGSRQALQTLLLPAPVELPCAPDESGPMCDRETSVADTIDRFGGESLRTLWGLHFICGNDLTKPPAGATQSCDHKAQSDMTVYSSAGHMHLLGRSIQIEINPETEDAQTLLDIELWDFDNQAATRMGEPQLVEKGDVLRVTCTHDVSLRQVLPALADIEPRYVTWGEGTTDEMCLGILSVTRA